MRLNLIQRGLLTLGGAILLLQSLNSVMDYQDRSLGSAQFLTAIILFVVAASSRQEKPDA